MNLGGLNFASIAIFEELRAKTITTISEMLKVTALPLSVYIYARQTPAFQLPTQLLHRAAPNRDRHSNLEKLSGTQRAEIRVFQKVSRRATCGSGISQPPPATSRSSRHQGDHSFQRYSVFEVCGVREENQHWRAHNCAVDGSGSRYKLQTKKALSNYGRVETGSILSVSSHQRLGCVRDKTRNLSHSHMLKMKVWKPMAVKFIRIFHSTLQKH